LGINEGKKVKTIPATLTRFTASPITEQKKRRVAGYARVSTDSDEQFTSYEAQIDYYTNYIKGRDDWEFVGVYTDEGITGTNTKKRVRASKVWSPTPLMVRLT
jgi:predicted site-specific integrase-resolvase